MTKMKDLTKQIKNIINHFKPPKILTLNNMISRTFTEYIWLMAR